MLRLPLEVLKLLLDHHLVDQAQLADREPVQESLVCEEVLLAHGIEIVEYEVLKVGDLHDGLYLDGPFQHLLSLGVCEAALFDDRVSQPRRHDHDVQVRLCIQQHLLLANEYDLALKAILVVAITLYQVEDSRLWRAAPVLGRVGVAQVEDQLAARDEGGLLLFSFSFSLSLFAVFKVFSHAATVALAPLGDCYALCQLPEPQVLAFPPLTFALLGLLGPGVAEGFQSQDVVEALGVYHLL